LFNVKVQARAWGGESAAISVKETFFISSDGPVRPGWMYLTSFRFASFSDSAHAGLIAPNLSLDTHSGSDLLNVPTRVMLGTPFEIELYADATVTSNLHDLDGSRLWAQSLFYFQLYEGDVYHLTPVAAYIDVSGAPEPPSFALYGLGGALVSAILFRHKRLMRLAT
jgi:hypothetical protein